MEILLSMAPNTKLKFARSLDFAVNFSFDLSVKIWYLSSRASFARKKIKFRFRFKIERAGAMQM